MSTSNDTKIVDLRSKLKLNGRFYIDAKVELKDSKDITSLKEFRLQHFTTLGVEDYNLSLSESDLSNLLNNKDYKNIEDEIIRSATEFEKNFYPDQEEEYYTCIVEETIQEGFLFKNNNNQYMYYSLFVKPKLDNITDASIKNAVIFSFVVYDQDTGEVFQSMEEYTQGYKDDDFLSSGGAIVWSY